MAKPLSVEALLADSNTKPVMGEITFAPVSGQDGKRLFEVNCPVTEVAVLPTGADSRKPRKIVLDKFGHLGTEHQLWAQQRRGCSRK